jgi:hypothetical protein
MDQNLTPSDGSDGKTNFQSDNVVTSDDFASQNQPAPALNAEPSSSPNNFAQTTVPALPDTQSNGISWTASEFIDHHKSAGWYFLLALFAIIVATIVWILTKDNFTSALVLAAFLLLGIYGAHKPRQLTYSVDELGITIGRTRHTFSEFRSFSVVSEGAFASIELVPLKRFSMYTTVYFDPADQGNIIDVLSTHLPIQEPRSDLIEQLMRRIRF